MSGRYPAGVLKVSGLKGLWKMFGTCLEGVLNKSGKHLEVLWKIFVWCLESNIILSVHNTYMQIFEYASMKVGKYVGMQVCKY